MSSPVPARLLAGIDIGGTNIRYALAAPDRPQALLVWHSVETPPGLTPEQFVAFIEAEVGRGLKALNASPETLAGIGCVAPGITDVEKGVVRQATNLGWENVPLVQLLENRLGVPAVIENDVNAAAMAEYTYGAGREAGSLVYLTVSTGVAAGIVLDGRLWRGGGYAAGEIGLFLPEPAHIGKDWRPNGCLELTAGGVGLARAWAARHGGNGTPGEAVEVFNRAREGHPEAVTLVRRAADYLAQAIVAIGALLNPDILVLGGSIARNEEWIAGRIREVVDATLPFPLPIAHSELEGDAPLIGALLLAARHVAAATPDTAGIDP
ncbi:ROK family protein [Rhodocaloribacter litoris]|uniref:ROK family protein n=1 Tax=Rhodocaloribacter litoris TaxID=2558931 RepID=UPI0014212C27|nr:ROK family protein [Rhodocaloribacter litoris]QXD16318.1 ROK family protein [Rhodocaloribacter litoris]